MISFGVARALLKRRFEDDLDLPTSFGSLIHSFLPTKLIHPHILLLHRQLRARDV